MTKQPTPLRQRMIEDMTIRNMAPSTQKIYVAAVANFSIFHGRSPDKLTFEDVRGYRLHLISRGLKPNSINPIMDAPPLPPVCILDPDGDIVRSLRRNGTAKPLEGWPVTTPNLTPSRSADTWRGSSATISLPFDMFERLRKLAQPQSMTTVALARLLLDGALIDKELASRRIYKKSFGGEELQFQSPSFPNTR